MWRVAFYFDGKIVRMTVKAANAINAVHEAIAIKAAMDGQTDRPAYEQMLLENIVSVVAL
jgi:hypothetical protein